MGTTRSDDNWEQLVDLYPPGEELPGLLPEPWADPTFDEVWASVSLGYFAQGLRELAKAKERRRRQTLYRQRVQRPGPHNLEFGRCTGSYAQVKGRLWLNHAREMGFSGDKARCKVCYTLIPISYQTGKLIGHTPTGFYRIRRADR